MKINKYKHDLDYSYTLGTTLTYELLKNKPYLIKRVYISPKINKTDSVNEILFDFEKNNIPVEENLKAFNILSPKGNCFMIAEFKKEENELEDKPHIVLVNPSDAGNLGTIFRTAAGFGIENIAIITPSVDYYDPKVIRSSMGAFFHLNVKYFDSIEDYIKCFPQHKLYSFMLKASKPINKIEKSKENYSLIFGNEATGLPDEYLNFSNSIIIPHSKNIDSLNLPIAVSIGLYEFTKNIWQE